MNVLYAVQGTGQGHISRARAMAAALSRLPVTVTWLFSGRPRASFFDMEPFGNFQHRHGLSFTSRAGRLRYVSTLRNNQLQRFLREARELDLTDYDLVVSDFEPVVARAARQQGRRLIGIGHQYAFGPETPRAGSSWLQEKILSGFAPADVPLGLHWYPYARNILPPILDLPDIPVARGQHLVVYLPFEDQDSVTETLRQFPAQQFIQYAPSLDNATLGNVIRRRADFNGFKRHLASSGGVICNSGFELISECLQWRKPVLTKPLAGQMEQHSNAMALEQLGYAKTTHKISPETLAAWLATPHVTTNIRFPNVAEALAHWLVNGCDEPVASLSERLWRPGIRGHIPSPRPGSRARDKLAARN